MAGCDLFQGFLFSRPVPLSDARALMPGPHAAAENDRRGVGGSAQ
jgi:EAL domain-containing protein (putative c-di-GMP-specific phosphodiesterase class I)